jgi:hypothetical protein
LSGCFGASDQSPADEPVGQAAPAAALRPDLKVPVAIPEVRLGRADIGSEPNIAAAPDGTLYVTTPLQIWRSTDGGESYQALGDPTCPVFQLESPACAAPLEQRNPGLDGGGDGDIAVDGSGRVHWLGLFGESGPIPYQSSDDLGETFTSGIDVSNETGSDREWITATPEGHVFAAWRDQEGYVVNRSLDRGETWLGKVEVLDTAPVGGQIIFDPSDHDRLYIPLVDTGGSGLGEAGPELKIARSIDAGASWEILTVAALPASASDLLAATSIFPTVAADDAGTLYMVVSQRQLDVGAPKPASQYAVYLYVSTDHGETWTAPRQVSPPMKVAIFPWVAAGAPGRIAITYYQNTVGLPNDNLPDLWNVMLVESVTADQAEPAFAVVQLNELPNHVGSVCTNGSICLLTGGDRSLLDFFELVIPPDGQPRVTWSGDSFTPPYISSTVFAGGAQGTPLR